MVIAAGISNVQSNNISYTTFVVLWIFVCLVYVAGVAVMLSNGSPEDFEFFGKFCIPRVRCSKRPYVLVSETQSSRLPRECSNEARF